jgi:glucose/arabinose dehydrogenase
MTRTRTRTTTTTIMPPQENHRNRGSDCGRRRGRRRKCLHCSSTARVLFFAAALLLGGGSSRSRGGGLPTIQMAQAGVALDLIQWVLGDTGALAATRCYDFYSTYEYPSWHQRTVAILYAKYRLQKGAIGQAIADIANGETYRFEQFYYSLCFPAPGQVSLASGSFSANRGDAAATVWLRRENGFDGTVSLDYETVPDSAVEGIDYVRASGTATWKSLQADQSVRIELNNTDLSQPTRQFKITVDNAVTAALLAPRTATITIYADKRVLPNYNMFPTTDYLQLNGAAQRVRSFFFGTTNANKLQLTDKGATTSGAQAGSVFYKTAVSMAQNASFRSFFQFEIDNSPSVADAVSGLIFGTKAAGSAGLAFVVQNDPSGALALGAAADDGGEGLTGISNLVAVCFETSTAASGGNATVSFRNASSELLRVDAPFNLTDGSVYGWVEYNGNSAALALYLSQDATKPRYIVANVTVDLSAAVGEAAYFGFTAGSSASGKTAQRLLQYRLDQLVPPEDPPTPPEVTLQKIDIVKNLNKPTGIAWLPDGTMLITEKYGLVKVFDGEKVLDTPFINLTDVVNPRSDRGLLSIKVHPNFTEDLPFVYLAYTYEGSTDAENPYPAGSLAGPKGRGNRVGRLVRYNASKATNYRTAIPESEYILIGRNSTYQYFNPTVDSIVNGDEPPAGEVNGEFVRDIIVQDSQTHGVCGIMFSLDGSVMFFGVGDGGSYNRIDKRNLRALNVNSLSGKVLRIDPITGEGLPDNPFYNLTSDPGANSAKVYHYGLRHPYSLSLDHSDEALYIGEVGWETWEEINTGAAGSNFGWPYYEGGSGGNLPSQYLKTLPEGQAYLATNPNITPPLYALNHVTFDIGAVIIGAVLSTDYYGKDYRGNLLFNNLEGGVMYHATFDQEKKIKDIGVFDDDSSWIVEMVEGPDGKLYYAHHLKGNGAVGYWDYL